MPRLVAGRAISASYQRSTFGKILQVDLVARVAPGPAEDGEVGDRQRVGDEFVFASRRSSTP